MKKLLTLLFLVGSLSVTAQVQAATDITGMNDKLEEAIKSNPNLKFTKMHLYNFKLKENQLKTVFNLKPEDGIDHIPQNEAAFEFYTKLINEGALPIIAVHRTNSVLIESIKAAMEEKDQP